MLRFVPRALVIALTMCALAAADDKDTPEEKVKKDLKNLQGKWRLSAVEKGGESVDLPPFDPFVFKEQKILSKDKEHASFKLDVGTDNSIIDLTMVEGDRKIEGIYTLDGDEFKMCLFMGDGASERPSKFNSEGGCVIVTMKREP